MPGEVQERIGEVPFYLESPGECVAHTGGGMETFTIPGATGARVELMERLKPVETDGKEWKRHRKQEEIDAASRDHRLQSRDLS
jgi:hypothetical protein